MGFIYKISNDINNNIYIGQTIRLVSKRWEQHLRAVDKNATTKLAQAMYILGSQHFKIEIIEECLNEELNQQERFWIDYYDSYNNGYNMTAGGGYWRNIKDDELSQEIFDLWDEGFNITDIANELNLTRITVRNRIYTYKNYSEEESQKRGVLASKQAKYKKTYQWDINGNLIHIYNSQIEAAEAVNITKKAINYAIRNNGSCQGYFWTDTANKPQNTTKLKNQRKVGQYDLQGNLLNIFNSRKEAAQTIGIDASGIGKCCSGRQKTSGGYIWKDMSKE